MWHEARKQEKKLRCMIVDYRKRAERRREFYEKFKADPTQFMQVHGRPSKIYLEPQIAASAENCMMPWQGNADNMIDRFDVRAHLDIIPEWQNASSGSGKSQAVEEEEQNPGINYERYRILIQNDLSGTSEDKFLHQIHLEEQFGNSATPHSHIFGGKNLQPKMPKAAIGYNYEDSTPAFTVSVPKGPQVGGGAGAEADEESEEEIDFDLLVNVDDLTHGQKAELNNFGTKYGLGVGDFMEYLNGDLEEKEKLRLAKLHEEEKQAMSGRKARRERRAYKDKLIMKKGYVSPPSYATYAAPPSPTEENDTIATISRRSSSRSESRSRSNSPEKITFITSFGGNESDDGTGAGHHRNSSVGRALPFEPSSSSRHITSNSSSTHPVFGPSLPSGSDKKGGDANKRSRFISRRSRSLDFISSSSRRRNNRSRSRSHSRRRSSHRRSSSRRRGRGGSSSRRRRRRSSSSSKSRSRSSRRRNYRSSRRSSSRSRSRSRGNRRKRRRSSRSTRSSRSRSRSRRRSKSSRSRSRSAYRSRRGRSKNRRYSRSSRSRSRDKSRRIRKSTRSSSSSSSSSSTTTSSPAKSTSTRGGKRRSGSSSTSPFRRLSKSRKSKSKERPVIPALPKESENGVSSVGTATTNPIDISVQPPSSTILPLKEATPPPPPVRRYYGRGRKATSKNSSSDSESLSESDSEKEDTSGGGGRQNGNTTISSNSKRDCDPPKGKSGLISSMMSSASKEETVGSTSFPAITSLSSISQAGGTSGSVAKLTPKERLRRKMQFALTRTFKADKEAEKQRQEKQVQERMEREESLRELTIKYRRREREKRHKDRESGGRSSSSDSSRSRSHSRSPSRSPLSDSAHHQQRRRLSRSRSRSPY